MNTEIGSYAVIFSSELAADDPEYRRAAERMEHLAREVPGFLGIESHREGKRGVTISYWESEEAIRCWRNQPEHLEAQARGKVDWYRRYSLRVTRIVRQSELVAPEG